MPDTPASSSQRLSPVSGRSRGSDDAGGSPRSTLAKAIPRRAGVSWWLGIVLALGFAALVTPAITAEHWLLGFAPGTVTERREAPFTVRAPMSGNGALRGGGLVVARGELASRDEAAIADAIAATAPRGPVLYLAFFALTFVLAALFTHHIGRSTKGRLVRVQIVSLAVILAIAAAVKLVLLSTALSALVVPIAVLAMVPTMVLDRVVGLATGVLAALVVSLLAPFDISLALLLLVQTAAAGLIVAERPRRRWLAALTAGVVTTLCTAATYLLLTYLTSGRAPDLRDPLHSPWLAAAIGPAVAALLAVPLIPIYQLLVGEITRGKLIALEDLGHPLLRRIAEKAPGTWQHSLMMANMAEIAANAIGASGRLVRVGAYFHDLGKSLQPKYFIENLEAGETSPHDLLPPEVSCDAIFAHVSDGIATARKAGLHERIVDFMHMHHGNGVLEYFWAKCREQGNPRGLTIEDFRYPGHPPQSRETALLAICDAVEAASRTLNKPDAAAIDSLVQRIVYGKLHLGQLDESGLSMGDLRRISGSLRETIRHANHGRIEYPWQKAGQDASASGMAYTTTAPRLDSLDRKPARETPRSSPSADPPGPGSSDAALAATADVKQPGDTKGAPATRDAARVRAGTARNAHPAEPPDADDARPGDRAVAAVLEPAPGDRWWSESAGEARPERDAERSVPAVAGSRESPATLRGRAPGPSPTSGDANVARPGREAASTLPGRAPGPSTTSGDPATTASTSREAPRAADHKHHPRPATAPPHGYEPASALTARPDPARTVDPTEIAAALASLVSRVAGAPFGKPNEESIAIGTASETGRVPSDVHAAGTQPMLPVAPPARPLRGTDADAAGPLRALAAASSGERAAEAAITQPLLPAAAAPIQRVLEGAGGHPVPATAREAGKRPGTAPPRASGLAGDARAVQGSTLRGPGDARPTLRRPPTDPVAAAALGTLNEEARVTVPRPATAPPHAPRAADFDAGVTEPSMPVLAVGDEIRVDVPLAARVDAAVEGDEWGKETPIVAPTKGELRALLGRPDPTRQQPIAEVERLQRRAAALADPPRRSPHPTTEVDPDDIEAAIEVAPPARRPHPNAIVTIKPRKPE